MTKPFELNDLFDYLVPHSTLTSRGVTTKKNPFEKIDAALMGQSGMKSYGDIRKTFKDELENNTEQSHLHGVGDVGDGGVLFTGDPYFKSCNIKDTNSLLKPEDLQGKKAAIFVTRNPYITPARRSTTDVDFFLNYSPSLFASQMMPYLDIEMQIIRTPTKRPNGDIRPATNVTSPTLMRFLMGSVPQGSTELGLVGRVLEDGQTNRGPIKLGDKTVDTVVSYSGMEMFLAPQTLTNMDELKGGDGHRLVDVKPFTSFASIESFDVTVANAGAAAMSHKKASLRIKLHDKARLAEMSAFLKPGGYAYVNVITTYGWTAPTGRNAMGSNDFFANFVNEKMRVRDRWMVVNSTFTFDPSGQVSIILELVTAGVRLLQEAEVGAQGELKDRLKKFDEIVETVKRVSDAVTNKLPVADLKVIQTLSGIAGRSLPDLTSMGESVKKMTEKLKGREKEFDLEKDAFIELGKKMDDLVSTKKGGKSVKEQLEAAAKIEAKQVFFSIRTGIDPFLPGPKGATAVKYFSQKYIKHLGEIVPAAGKTPADLQNGSQFASFGSVFTKIAAKSILAQDICDELQVIFYGLNDSCGPVSGQSIAEFPIEMKRLEWEYANAIKATGRITLENFLRLVIECQFSDKRAAAYGMSKAYAKWEPDKQQIVNDEKNYDNEMLAWHADHGSFTQPIINMYLESGTDSEDRRTLSDLRVSERNRSRSEASKSTKIIKRIHIYDAAATPFDGLKKIVNLGGAYAMGDNVKPNDQWKLGSSIFENYVKNKLNRDPTVKGKTTGTPVVSTFSPVPGYEEYIVNADSRSLIEHVSSFAPAIRPGVNGSLVYNISLASKTTGLQGSINIINQNSAYAGQGGALPPPNGLEDPNGMPLRFAPAQLTMQTFGCPIASLYQQYFVDMQTGTTLDNLYTCTAVKHTLTPGKFTTDWTFLYTDAYGKFAGAPSLVAMTTQLAQKASKAATATPSAT